MVKLTENINRAMSVSAWAHDQQGQYRKGGDIPYIVHPFGVMMLAGEVTDDEDTLVSCLLHDVLEDVDPSIYGALQMQADFGSNVAQIVRVVTKNEEIEGWRARNIDYISRLRTTQHVGALVVCAADKAYNLGTTLHDFREFGPAVWQRFTTKSVDDQLWYYDGIYDMLNERTPESPLVQRIGQMLVDLRDELSVV